MFSAISGTSHCFMPPLPLTPSWSRWFWWEECPWWEVGSLQPDTSGQCWMRELLLWYPQCQPQQPAGWRAGPVWVESWTVSPPWAARQLTASLPPVPAMHYLHFLPSLHLLLPPRARVVGRVHSGVSPGHWVSRAVTCEGAESCSWTGSARWKVSAIMSLICHFLAGAPETRGELSWAEGWQWDPLPSAPFIKVL